MIRAILDFPESLLDINAGSQGSQVLLDFNNLVRNEVLDIVPSLTPQRFYDWQNNIPLVFRGSRGNFERILRTIVRWDGGDCEAVPILGPQDLSRTWKCGLYDAMAGGSDWRTPQIIVPAIRQNRWPAALEVEISIEACDGNEPSSPHTRVIAELEKYPNHPNARADTDPWDLRHVRASNVANVQENPCMLPKPPLLKGVSLSEIHAKLADVRSVVGSRRYYVPPLHWNPVLVNKEEWRRGRAFPYGDKNNRSGWRDRDGLIWHWDRTHPGGHWDVQLDSGEHENVSHTGEIH